MKLFVCRQGRIRSRTAEIIALLGGVEARSCGTDADAIVTLSPELLWPADTIICMEDSQVEGIKSLMAAEGKPVVSLGLQDIYDPFEPRLVSVLVKQVRERLKDLKLANAMERGWQLMRRDEQPRLRNASRFK